MGNERILSQDNILEDDDQSLRPAFLNQYVGQNDVKERCLIFILKLH